MLGISLWSAVNLICPAVVTDWWLPFRQSLMVAWRCWGLKDGMCLSSTWAAGPAAGRPSAGALLLRLENQYLLGRLCSVLGDECASREQLGYAGWWGWARRRSLSKYMKSEKQAV